MVSLELGKGNWKALGLGITPGNTEQSVEKQMIIHTRSALILPGTTGTSLHPFVFLATTVILENAIKL